MKLIRILLAAIIAVLGATAIAQVTVAKEASQNPNDASYWESRTEHPSVCYKHDPPTERNSHGYLTDGGKSVTLYQFNQSWPGDHWELLVVKSGSVDNGDGDGNKVYKHPAAGTAYFGPLNGGGEQGAVSHWIVCKGTTPETQTTQVSWTATDGTCDATAGTLAMSFDPNAVEYVGDAAGTYPAGTSVDGTFTAKPGYSISGPAQFSHTFAVTGSPCTTTATPPTPEFVEPTCADRDVAIVDPVEGDGITYQVIDGELLPGGTVTVQAVAEQGIVLEGTTEWTHTFGEVTDDDCVVPGTPSSSIDAACGKATLTFTNTIGQLDEGYTGGSIDFTYTVDDEQFTVTVAAGESKQVDLVFGEDTGTHTVAIGDGQPYVIDTDCEPETVEPAAPQFVEPTCESLDGADVVLPSVEGVRYDVTGQVAAGGAVTVTATAEDGFVLQGTTEWTYTFADVTEDGCNPPVEPAIEVAAFSPVCQSDIPFIDYAIEVTGTDADRATLTFIDNTGTVIRTDTDMPLSGRVVYPGAAGAPNPDWPGWKLNPAGLWVPDPTDANWRDGLTVRVDVNPTAFGEVAYPAATEVCYQPPTNASGGPTTTVASSGVTQTTTVVAELPKTGSNGTSTIVTLALALMAVGALLAGAVRIRRPRLQ